MQQDVETEVVGYFLKMSALQIKFWLKVYVHLVS